MPSVHLFWLPNGSRLSSGRGCTTLEQLAPGGASYLDPTAGSTTSRTPRPAAGTCSRLLGGFLAELLWWTEIMTARTNI